MIVMKSLALCVGAVASLIASCGGGNNSPVVSTNPVPVTAEAPTTTRPTTTAPTTTAPAPTTTTQPPLVLTFTPRCPEAVAMAYKVGWPVSELQKLDKVAYRESRCNPKSHNKTDPTRCGSRGTLQINGSWVLPNKWWPIGYLPHFGVAMTCDDLFDLETNIRSGLYLFLYSFNKHGDGWVPWRTTAGD